LWRRSTSFGPSEHRFQGYPLVRSEGELRATRQRRRGPTSLAFGPRREIDPDRSVSRTGGGLVRIWRETLANLRLAASREIGTLGDSRAPRVKRDRGPLAMSSQRSTKVGHAPIVCTRGFSVARRVEPRQPAPLVVTPARRGSPRCSCRCPREALRSRARGERSSRTAPSSAGPSTVRVRPPPERESES
jgi:hypothetical protein